MRKAFKPCAHITSVEESEQGESVGRYPDCITDLKMIQS